MFNIEVFLLDGEHLNFSASTASKVKHAIIMIRDLIGLENDADFGIFALHNGLATGVFTLLGEDDILADVVKAWPKESMAKKYFERGDVSKVLPEGSNHLVFKRVMYLPWSPLYREIEDAQSVDDAAHRLEFIEAQHHTLFGRYPLTKVQAVELAGLLTQGMLGDHDEHSYPEKGCLAPIMQKILPPYVRNGRRMPKYEARVVAAWEKLAGLSPLECQQQYIEKVKFWFPFYGAEFIRINYQRKMKGAETQGKMLSGITIGIGHNGVHILQRTVGKDTRMQPRRLLVSHSMKISKSGCFQRTMRSYFLPQS